MVALYNFILSCLLKNLNITMYQILYNFVKHVSLVSYAYFLRLNICCYIYSSKCTTRSIKFNLEIFQLNFHTLIASTQHTYTYSQNIHNIHEISIQHYIKWVDLYNLKYININFSDLALNYDKIKISSNVNIHTIVMSISKCSQNGY